MANPLRGWLFCFSVMLNANQLMHGSDWQGQGLSGWLAQEKLDGCRLFWDGHKAWARQGRPVALPDHVTLPAGFSLDCELYAGPGALALASNAIRLGPSHWSPAVTLHAFDAPGIAGGYCQRHAALVAACAGTSAHVPPFFTISRNEEAFELMRSVQRTGGEGLMLRCPTALYVTGRVHTMLKLKWTD